MAGAVETIAQLVAEIQSVLADGQAPGSISPGRISQLEQDLVASLSWRMPVVSITDPEYGAVGNGITDDAPAIQAAVAAVSGSGGVVFFPTPPGGVAYLVESTITLPFGVFFKGVTTPGWFDGFNDISFEQVAGSPCRIKAGASCTTAVISPAFSSVRDNDNVLGYGIRDLVIDANFNATHCINLPASTFSERRLFLDNVELTNANQDGLYVSNSGVIEARSLHVNRCKVLGLYLDAGTADSVFNGIFVRGCGTSGTSFTSNAGIYCGPGATRNTFCNGRLEENYGFGFFTNAGNDLNRLVNMEINHNDLPGVGVLDTASTLINVVGCTIAGNGFSYGNYTGASSGDFCEVYCNQGRMFLSGCVLTDDSPAPTTNVYVAGSGKIVSFGTVYVTASPVSGSDGTGVYVNPGSTDVVNP